jgi:hypothetical protein
MIMKKVFIAAIISLVFSIVFYTCTEENNPVFSNDPVVDPITNTWTSEADNNYEIFFQTFDSLVSRGIFSGREFHPEEGETELCGFFDGTYVEFDVRRPVGGRTKFKGTFINSNRLELESSEGSLILTR